MKPWTEQVREQTGRTLVELVGRSRLLIEGHGGILGYSPEEILVAADYGLLRIRGEQLQLCRMSREQLFVSGTVYAVIPEGREG